MIDEFLHVFFTGLPAGAAGFLILGAVVVFSLLVLGKGADILVDEAVCLSLQWGVPKMLVGATVVSLGTTLPEVTVSVMSALKGAPGLALGNAVGSIICDTGLILGIAALIKPLPFDKKTTNRQGWIQFASGLLLIAVCLLCGARVPQYMGFVFLALLAAYIVYTIRSGAAKGESEGVPAFSAADTPAVSTFFVFLKLILGIALVIASSKVLIPAVQETALRCRIPETVIAATLVAFGTSLPELITAVTAARKGHGELAVGNIIGADILNVLFVTGASAAVTAGGLIVDRRFFTILFPAMLFVLIVFRCAVLFSKKHIGRPVGALLLASYAAVTVVSYVW